MIALVFSLGIAIGTALGLFVAALCIAAKDEPVCTERQR